MIKSLTLGGISQRSVVHVLFLSGAALGVKLGTDHGTAVVTALGIELRTLGDDLGSTQGRLLGSELVMVLGCALASYQ